MPADVWTITGTIAAVLVALLALVDFLDKRRNYLKKLWRWALEYGRRLTINHGPIELELPKQEARYAATFPARAIPLHSSDGMHKELLKYIMRGEERLIAYRTTREGLTGVSYLVEWQRPGQTPKSVQTPHRAQANDQWLTWYREWKNQPGGFGGSFGSGLDGAPPFAE